MKRETIVANAIQIEKRATMLLAADGGELKLHLLWTIRLVATNPLDYWWRVTWLTFEGVPRFASSLKNVFSISL